MSCQSPLTPFFCASRSETNLKLLLTPMLKSSKPCQFSQTIVYRCHSCCQWCSVQFSRSVVSDSLQLHGPQHTRPPCSSPTPRVYPNSCPLSQWCQPTISTSVITFSSCLQSIPALGSFQMSQFFTSGGQSIRISASTSVLPMNTQDWSPLV